MNSPSPSKDSTTTNTTPPPSSPPQHPPLTGDGDDVVVPTPTEVTNPTGSEEGKAEEAAGEMLLKTAAQVLEELAGSDDSGNGNGGGGSGSIPLGSGGGGAEAGAVAVAVGGSGGGTVKSDKRKGDGGAVEVVVKEKETKKPRLTEVKDPPSGPPTCPICQRQFQTWKGAFGHMRSHPDREYRGFFRPPVFGSSSAPATDAPPPSNAENDNNKGADVGEASKGDGEKKGEEPKRGMVFDLNNPMMEGEGSSSAAAAAPAGGNQAPDEAMVEERVQEEGRNLRGFDLNEMPKDDDDE
ncbi:uncharacterized protein LOC130737137 [Lotus japonicus]|uniref:uncharacterized protein LOC130737137 n=1 Tax=Lotus japonicus TaxID=34305 RepID=UPI00258EEBC3|nr:uncharacterized protein LOC130737137 [Lotus japonicus]